ncbi:MAG: hypothetical protein QGI45_07300 [Myxococcota bacterium]|jgi:hypothetical protein|nr:hypothetical protein [Myxococcota bacterium]
MNTVHNNILGRILLLVLLPLALCACGEEGVYFDENTGQMSYEAIGADESGTCWCQCPGKFTSFMKDHSEEGCPSYLPEACMPRNSSLPMQPASCTFSSKNIDNLPPNNKWVGDNLGWAGNNPGHNFHK